MHKKWFLIFFIFFIGESNGENSIKWVGSVKDTLFSNFEKLNIEILETGDTQTVKPDAEFNFVLPRDTLWNVCVSFEKTEKCFELVYIGKDSVFNASLKSQNYSLKETVEPVVDSTPPEVEVDSAMETSQEQTEFSEDRSVQLRKVVLRVRKVPKRSLGKSTISSKMIKRMPGLAEADVIRSIQALPGVVASSDFSSKIYVRGGGADQNLFLLDNGVVYSPVHFFGLFSTFLVEGVDEVDFYKGGFDPKYGNRLSSVVDIKSRKGGDPEKNEFFSKSSVKISTFASQAHTEGRQGSFSWLHAGRITYINQILDLLKKTGLTVPDIDYKFFDLQGRLDYTFNKNHNLSFTYYYGEDNLDFQIVNINWGNQTYPLNYNFKFGKYFEGQATLSYSIFDQTFALGDIFAFVNDIDVWNGKLVTDFTGFKNHTIQTGGQIKRFGIAFVNDSKVTNTVFRDPTNFWLYSFFIQDKWLFDWMEISIGNRMNYSTKVEETQHEPRFSLKFNLPKNQSVEFHTGYYYQYINSILFNDQETINEFYYPAKKLTIHEVKPTNSMLFSLGYSRSGLWDKLDYSIEGYYKTLNDLLVFAPDEVDQDQITDNANLLLGDFFKTGEGYSFGLELSTKVNLGPVFGSTSYSHGQSVMLEKNDTLAFHPDWHQAHSWKLDLALNWRGKDGIWKHKKEGRYFRSSTQLKFATGLPFTERIGYVPAHLRDQGSEAGGPNPSFEDNITTPFGNRNTTFVPAYFRWDFKAIDIGRYDKWNFSWTILNITNHENIFLYFYDTTFNPPVKNTVPQFPFFPVLLSFEYYF